MSQRVFLTYFIVFLVVVCMSVVVFLLPKLYYLLVLLGLGMLVYLR